MKSPQDHTASRDLAHAGGAKSLRERTSPKAVPAAFRQRISPESQVVGRVLAKITDDAEPAVRAKFPGISERCKSCAFRSGTLPNQCTDTIIEAFDCAIRGVPFYCHLRFNADGTPRDLCGGWQIAIGNIPVFVAISMQPAIAEYQAIEAENQAKATGGAS